VYRLDYVHAHSGMLKMPAPKTPRNPCKGGRPWPPHSHWYDEGRSTPLDRIALALVTPLEISNLSLLLGATMICFTPSLITGETT
jgi:hypothetical protein